MVKLKNTKLNRERRKLAKAARKGSIGGSGKYKGKRHDSLRERSET